MARRTPQNASNANKNNGKIPPKASKRVASLSNSNSSSLASSNNNNTSSSESGNEKGDSRSSTGVPPPLKKPSFQIMTSGAQQQLGGGSVAAVTNAASNLANYGHLINSSLARSNLVTMRNIDTLRGTIGEITFQFQCHRCAGSGARCFQGKAYCISCCDHPGCK